MLQALKDFGEFIGLEKGFESELKSVRNGDKIAIIRIKDDNSFNIDEEIKYEEDKEYEYLFYYAGSNSSVTGTTGIMGISPFFFKSQHLKANKVKKSYRYNEIYKNLIGRKDNFIKDYLDYLKENAENLGKIKVSDKDIPELEDCLNKNIIPEKLKKILKPKQISENTIIKKEEDDKWSIIDQRDVICTIKKEKEMFVISINLDWLFFKEFNGKNTMELHKKFIEVYSKLPRKKDIEEIDGTCSVCGKEGKIGYPKIPFFAAEISNYAHNLKEDLSAFRIRICSDCEPYIAAGWRYLNSIFGGKLYILIPKLRENANRDSLREFIKRINKNNLSNFEKLNLVLRNRHLDEELELFFIVMKREQQKTVIEKFVQNYKTFAVRFENETLAEGNELEYVDWESKIEIPEIRSYFDLERLLRFFFVNDKNKYFSKYFYELYHHSKQRRVVPENMESSFKHRLFIYRDNLFSFIYETNLYALKDSMLNDICLNFLLYEIRKQRDFWKVNTDINLCYKIMEGLNYYYFLKNKIRGDIKMKEQILSLKYEFVKLENEKAKEEAEEKIEKIVEEDERLIYYLIGQFIRKIDNFRGKKGKNKIFDSFVQSINRRNIKQRFVEDILQKQNYYIEKLNPKAKFVFDIMSNNLDKLFEYEPYEEMIISLITGYYSRDILKSSKNGGEQNGE
ncbi:hypothetical protein DRN58_01930 [Thermococci archaeon]|nr:MAG: hypothetical protein DRN58_01930 [Thermococci archaeon]